MPILETQDLTYVYGAGTPFEKTAVDHISLQIEEGELVGVIGHTGSGKSTFVQQLNGLLKPTSGKVLLKGKDIWAEQRKSGPSGSRWGWCSNTRSTSFLRKRWKRISRSAQKIWGFPRKKSSGG